MIFKKLFPLLVILMITTFCINFSPGNANAQSELLKRKDSIVVGDTISKVTPGGVYEKGAFTLVCTAMGDTLKPMVQYGNSSEWVTTSVKNIRTQTSDTTIIITANSWPRDYEINDPCVIGFRLVSLGASYNPARKTYVDFRFRRR